MKKNLIAEKCKGRYYIVKVIYLCNSVHDVVVDGSSDYAALISSKIGIQ